MFQNTTNIASGVRSQTEDESSGGSSFGAVKRTQRGYTAKNLKGYKCHPGRTYKCKDQLAASQNKQVACSNQTKSEIKAIKAGHSKFEETVTDMLGRQLKSIIAVIKQHACNV
jgi:hypothetical protein